MIAAAALQRKWSALTHAHALLSADYHALAERPERKEWRLEYAALIAELSERADREWLKMRETQAREAALAPELRHR